jgi:hypothetical protein
MPDNLIENKSDKKKQFVDTAKNIIQDRALSTVKDNFIRDLL